MYVNPDNNGIAKGSVERGGKSQHLIYICIANLHGVKWIQTTTVALEIMFLLKTYVVVNMVV